MRAKRLVAISGLFVVLIALVWAWLFRRVSISPGAPVSISFLGYTNQSGAAMAVFQVTNRTAAVFSCFVGPRVSETNLLVHDVKAAASPGFVPSHGSFRFVVAASRGSNQWRVSVELRELREGLPPQLAAL